MPSTIPKSDFRAIVTIVSRRELAGRINAGLHVVENLQKGLRTDTCICDKVMAWKKCATEVAMVRKIADDCVNGAEFCFSGQIRANM